MKRCRLRRRRNVSLHLPRSILPLDQRNRCRLMVHLALMPANLTTSAHFLVSSATSLAKSATEPESGSLPRSAAGSASAALTCRLSRSTISAGVPSDAEPAGHREAGDHVAGRWDVRQHPRRAGAVTPSARSAPDWIRGLVTDHRDLQSNVLRSRGSALRQSQPRSGLGGMQPPDTQPR